MEVSVDSNFVDAVRSRERISGLSHNFYRYPARFSPLFARAAIEAFTTPGEVVLDPFMGGGTTLVEAASLGRQGLGTDINSLSVFVSRVKTTPLSKVDRNEVVAWADLIVSQLNLRQKASRNIEYIESGYHRNIDTPATWPIRKFLELAIEKLDLLSTAIQQDFARCILLKAAQWALDCRKDIPSVNEFRVHIRNTATEMSGGAQEFEEAVRGSSWNSLCLHRSAEGIETDARLFALPSPSLVVTSPPYPGVHVLYHRWQVRGRRETAAPYWIANSLDGDGASFYTFGDRHQPKLTNYYDAALKSFTSIAAISSQRTRVVQMIAFNEPEWQLPEYLFTMERAGFEEVFHDGISDTDDGRLWRNIPNRKFYADQKGSTSSSKEVVLFHRLRLRH